VNQSGLASISRTSDHHTHAEQLSRTIRSLELLEVSQDLLVRFVGEFIWQGESLEVFAEINATTKERDIYMRRRRDGHDCILDTSDGAIDLQSFGYLGSSISSDIIPIQADELIH
jgi:hypothetical protein